MDLEKLNKMWAVDCKIDENNLVGEATNIPKLHNKYYMLYCTEGLKLKKLRSELVELEKAKIEYYNGTMDEAELKQRGWKPNPLKILRADINKYIESDKDIITMSLKIGYSESIVKYLEDIVKNINNRNFLLKTIVDWSRFQSGG